MSTITKKRYTTGNGCSTNLCVDHNHKTGKLRGLLCRTCNSALGLVDDNMDWLLNCIEYLRKYRS